jgi:uncharacterized SAM-binding protein YcdF (DUF218 family)
MPEVPLIECDIAFLFGTRHGIEDFCMETYDLWRRGLFRKVLISGGYTAQIRETEAEVISARLRQLGMPQSDLILENAATNTGQNVVFGLEKLADAMDISSIKSVLLIGKICSARRYLMTLERHWPGRRLSFHGVNYFGVPVERWYEHDEFRARVMDEFVKIPRYLRQDFLSEIEGFDPYPDLRYCEELISAASNEIERRRADSTTSRDHDKRLD